MRPLIWLLILATLAVALTLAARFDSGYVLLVYPPWRVEMSFILAFSVTIGLFFLLHLVLGLLRATLSLPSDVKAWRLRQRQAKSDDEIARAVAALLADQPEHARQLAEKALERGASPRWAPVGALVAARTAEMQGEKYSARRHLDAVKVDVGELIAARQALQERLALSEKPPEG